MRSYTCRQKLKGKREVYRRSDGRQELRSCIRSGISQRQPTEFIRQWCYMVSLSFLQNEPSRTVLSPLQSTYLFCRQTD